MRARTCICEGVAPTVPMRRTVRVFVRMFVRMRVFVRLRVHTCECVHLRSYVRVYMRACSCGYVYTGLGADTPGLRVRVFMHVGYIIIIIRYL